MTRPDTILIVEDEPAARDAIVALLAPLGYQLSVATDGAEALALAQQMVPDVVLLDVMLPQMDGFEVCKRMRADPTLKDVPILLITALDDRDSRLRGIESGADEFVSKPFNRAEVRARVRTITRLNRYRRLLQERAKFDWVIENADEGYVIAGAEDELRYANAPARRYLGLPLDGKLPPDERFLPLALRSYQARPPEAWAGWPCPAMSEKERGSGSAQVRYLVRPATADSPAQWLAVEQLDVPDAEGTEHVLRLRDETARIGMEQMVWRFQAGLAHKLNTPLNGLVASLAFLRDDAESMSGAEVAEMAGLALDSAHRLHRVIQDLVEQFSGPTATQPGVACTVAHAAQLLRGATTDLGLLLTSLTIADGLEDRLLTLSPQTIERLIWEVLQQTLPTCPSRTVAVSISQGRRGEALVRIREGGDRTTLPGAVPAEGAGLGFADELSSAELGMGMVASQLWSVGGGCHVYADAQGALVELSCPLR